MLWEDAAAIAGVFGGGFTGGGGSDGSGGGEGRVGLEVGAARKENGGEVWGNGGRLDGFPDLEGIWEKCSFGPLDGGRTVLGCCWPSGQVLTQGLFGKL